MKNKPLALFFLISLVCIGFVYAVPLNLDSQGLIRNATTGALLTGTHIVNMTFYKVSDDSVAFSNQQSLVLDNGIYNMHIGMDTASYFIDDLYMRMKIDNNGQLPAVNLTSSPYALYCEMALNVSWDNVNNQTVWDIINNATYLDLSVVSLANDSMRDYVDSANISVKEYTDNVLGLANDSCTAYTDLANTSVKDYADANFNKWGWDSINHSSIDIITDYNSTFNQSIWDIINNATYLDLSVVSLANASMKAYTDSKITNVTTNLGLANTSMKDYADANFNKWSWDSTNHSEIDIITDYNSTFNQSILGICSVYNETTLLINTNTSMRDYVDLANTSVKDYADNNFNKWSWDITNHSAIDIITDYNSTFNQSIWDIINNATYLDASIVSLANASINKRFTNTTNLTNVILANASCSAYTDSANNSMREYGDKTFVNITGDTMTGTLFGTSINMTDNSEINKTLYIINGRVFVGQLADFDPREGLSVVGDIDIIHISTEADDHAFEIDVDAAGFGDVKAIDVVYDTGAISTGQDEGVILINIDESDATGGDVIGVEVLATEGSAIVYGMLVGAGVHPIAQLSGTFEDMDTANNSGTDSLTNFTTTENDSLIFVSDDDFIIIGHSTRFEEIEFILNTTSSNPGIKPTFEFSNGSGTWDTFTPVDGTDGMRHTAIIAWNDEDIPTWDTGAGSEYLIRITRTQNSLSRKPIEGKVQIAATIKYVWDKDGNIVINGINASVVSVEDNTVTLATIQTTATNAEYAGLNVKSPVGTWGLYTGAAGHTLIAGDFGIYDWDAGGGGGVYRFVIKDDGRVGIGTSNPNRNLDIEGTGNVYIEIHSTNYSQFVIGSETRGFVFYDDTTNDYRMVIQNGTGNVGIGTTTPSHKLEVAGSVNVSGSVNASAFYDDGALLIDTTTFGLANTSVKDYADANFNKWSWDATNHSKIDIVIDYNSTFNRTVWNIINNLTYLDATVVSLANASMKAYADSQITNVTTNLGLANTSCSAYTDLANTSVKDYTDSKITNVTTNIGLANTSVKDYADANFNKWSWDSTNHSKIDIVIDYNSSFNSTVWNIINNATYLDLSVVSLANASMKAYADSMNASMKAYGDSSFNKWTWDATNHTAIDIVVDYNTSFNTTVVKICSIYNETTFATNANTSMRDYVDLNFTNFYTLLEIDLNFSTQKAYIDAQDSDTTYTNASFDLSEIPTTGNVDIGAYNFSVGHCLNWSNGFKICTK